MTSRARSRGPYRVELTCRLEFDSGLHVGSGDRLSVLTDAPVLLDAQGLPYLPGSSVRGVVRDWCVREAPRLGVDKAALEHLLGPGEVRAGADDRQGRLTVFDVPLDSPVRTEVRDQVAIDEERGAARAGAKFDRERAIGARGTLRLVYEGDGADDAELRLLHAVGEALEHGVLAFGGGTGSGLGWVRETTVQVSVLDRSNGGLSQYLQARADGSVAPGKPQALAVLERAGIEPDAPPADEPRPWSWLRLPLTLRFDGPMLVAGPNPDETDSEARYLVSDGVAVLPGSSFRGVLRSHAGRIARTTAAEKAFAALFGEVAGKDRAGGRGLLRVRDGRLAEEPRPLKLEHVAIDRVTGFAAFGRLFDTWALGSPVFETELFVHWDEANEEHKAALRLLLFVLRDASESLLWAGSRTTRGYGWLKEVALGPEAVRSVARDGARTTSRIAAASVFELANELELAA